MATISYLTTIEFDHGAVKTLPDALTALEIDRPLLVTDRGIVACGLFERLSEALPSEASWTLFEDTPPNPTESAVQDALARYREVGCNGLIAFGGGSSIDLAKAVGLLATHDGPLVKYAAALGGVAKITPAVAPLIAVPTTAGTGSEVGRGALITLADGRKLGFLSPHFIPKRAICDPELTLGLPPGLTAATGMDALTHCIETFLSPRINPPAEAIAIDGAARAMSWIERAFGDGSDRDARWHMMMASLQGGMTFQKGLGAVHAMSHPLGGLSELKLHHGTLNAVILPAVLRFNAGHVGDKYERLCSALGLEPGTDLAATIENLNRRLGLPESLRAMGVGDSVIPAMVEGALADHCAATNPRPATAEDYSSLFEAALG